MSVDYPLRTLWVALPGHARCLRMRSPGRTCVSEARGFNEEAVQFRWSLVSRFRELCVHPVFVPDCSRLRVGRIELKSGL